MTAPGNAAIGLYRILISFQHIEDFAHQELGNGKVRPEMERKIGVN